MKHLTMRQFMDCLEYLECREKYLSNIEDIYSVERLLKYNHYEFIIEYSFIWALTEQGHDYWKGIDNKFYEYFKERFND